MKHNCKIKKTYSFIEYQLANNPDFLKNMVDLALAGFDPTSSGTVFRKDILDFYLENFYGKDSYYLESYRIML